MDTRKRTLAKTISFRILATIATMILVYVFTKSWTLMGILGGLDLVSKLLLYYFHERAWDKVEWGKK